MLISNEILDVERPIEKENRWHKHSELAKGQRLCTLTPEQRCTRRRRGVQKPRQRRTNTEMRQSGQVSTATTRPSTLTTTTATVHPRTALSYTSLGKQRLDTEKVCNIHHACNISKQALRMSTGSKRAREVEDDRGRPTDRHHLSLSTRHTHADRPGRGQSARPASPSQSPFHTHNFQFLPRRISGNMTGGNAGQNGMVPFKPNTGDNTQDTPPSPSASMQGLDDETAGASRGRTRLMPYTESQLRSVPVANIGECPHKLAPSFEPTGPEELLHDAPMTPNTGQFPSMALAQEFILDNIEDELRADVEAQPSLFLALVIHNGGHEMRTVIPNHAFDFEKAIKGLHLPGRIVCHKTDPKTPVSRKMGSADKYASPIIVVIEVENEEAQSYLLRQVVLSFSPLLSCGVMRFDNSARSWVVGAFVTSSIRGESEAEKIRWMLYSGLWSNQALRGLVNEETFAKPGSLDERFHRVVLSVHPRWIEEVEHESKWLVFMAPFTENYHAFEKAKAIVRKTSFTQGRLSVKSINANHLYNCALCKLQCHTFSKCPLTQIPDWLGPKKPIHKVLIDEGKVKEKAARTPPAPTRGRGRGRPPGR